MTELATSAASPRVLIIDGEPDERRALRHIIEAQGARVFAVPSSDEARALVRDEPVDLVLLDVALEAVDALPWQEHAPPPVIFICHREDTDALSTAFEAGAVDALARPLQHREVTARVGTQLKLVALARELAACEQKLAEQKPAHSNSATGSTLKLSEVKEQLISDALAQTHGNVTQAAKLLGVHRSWLYRRR